MNTIDYYLDNHVYEHFFLDRGFSADEITALLEKTRIRLIISEHNIHETVSCWKSREPDKVERGRQILKLQLDLQPVRFLLPTPQLISYEIGPYIDNDVRGPFLDRHSEDVTRADLRLLVVEGATTSTTLESMIAGVRRKANENCMRN